MDADRQRVPEGPDRWLTGLFRSTFDLISSEYGWSDCQVLDLTLARMRQIRKTIAERRDEDWLRTLRLEEQKLRYLVGAIASANGGDGRKAADGVRLAPEAAQKVAPPGSKTASPAVKPHPDLPPGIDYDRLPSTSRVIGMFSGSR